MAQMNSVNADTIPFLDLKAQYDAIADEVDAALMNVVHSTSFILGADVEAFEQDYARFCEAKYCVGLDNGMSALELALKAYGIGPGDEVITVANSFIATAFSILNAGATPRLVDADPHTYTIDVHAIERAITPRTRAIMPVHLYGQPADMDSILALARQHNLIVIEDACQAHGARYKGRRVGGLGHAAAFSFYPGKNLGGFGDGGALVTNDLAISDQVRMSRNYGQSKKYHHDVQGYNRRLDTLQAAVLRVKLKYLDSWNAARSAHAKTYARRLAGSSVQIPVEAQYAQSVWHLYVVHSDKRDALKQYLDTQGIHAAFHYPVPIHLQPACAHLGYKKGDFPVSERCAEQCLSLPMFAELSDDDVVRVADAIKAFDAQGAHSHDERFEVAHA